MFSASFITTILNRQNLSMRRMFNCNLSKRPKSKESRGKNARFVDVLQIPKCPSIFVEADFLSRR
jgi:N-acetylmuramoyl-L-alanine amidase